MPGAAIVIVVLERVVLELNVFGDWLRDRLDPRLRQI
jgi:ABC-type dipeptide/oligopeptide/nickel transport system permease subunit